MLLDSAWPRREYFEEVDCFTPLSDIQGKATESHFFFSDFNFFVIVGGQCLVSSCCIAK